MGIEVGTNCFTGSMCLSLVPMMFKKKDGADRAWYDPRRYETTPHKFKFFFWMLFVIVGCFSWWATYWGNWSPVLQGVLTSLTVLIVVGNGLLGLTNNYSHLVFWSSGSEQPASDDSDASLLPAPGAGPGYGSTDQGSPLADPQQPYYEQEGVPSPFVRFPAPSAPVPEPGSPWFDEIVAHDDRKEGETYR